MKIVKFVVFLISLLPFTVKGQSNSVQIEGFWGITLGQSQTEVVRKVKSLYPSADYEKYIKGTPYSIHNVQLAGLEMSNCYLYFERNTFYKAEFLMSAGGEWVNPSRADSYMSSLQPIVQSDYKEICDVFSEKYGKPRMSGLTATWSSSNGNSITVKPWTKADGFILDGLTFVAAGVKIIYSKGTHVNDF